MPDLILLEFEEDVAEAVELWRGAQAGANGCSIVALTAEAMESLDEARISYELPSDRDHMDRCNAQALDNIRRVGELDELVQEKLRAVFPEIVEAGFSPIRCHAHEMHTLLDALAFRCLTLQCLVARYRPGTLAYFFQNDLGRRGSSLLFEPEEGIWGIVCRAARQSNPQWARSLDWIELPSRARPDGVRRRLVSPLGRRWSRGYVAAAAPRLYRGLRCLKHAILALQRRPPGRPVRAPKGQVVMVPSNPDLTLLATQLIALGWGIVSWTGPASVSRPEAVGPGRAIDRGQLEALGIWFKTDPRIAELLTFAGVSTRQVADDKWHLLLGELFAVTAGWYESAASWLAANAPAAVLVGELGHDGWARSLLEAARAAGVKTIFYQWGGNYGYTKQPYLLLGELQADCCFAYTPKVAEVLEGAAQTYGFPLIKAVAVGSLYFAQLKAPSRSLTATPMIYYVTSTLSGPYRYGPYHSPEDTAYYVAERRILTALAHRFPRRVVLKAHPGRPLAFNPIRRYINRRRLPVKVETKPLEHFLGRPGIWVLDSAGTAMQQLIVTGQPIVYVDSLAAPLAPPASKTLSRSVWWVDYGGPDFEERLTAALDEAVHAYPSGRWRQCHSFEREYVRVDRRTPAELAVSIEKELEALVSIAG